MKKLIKSQPISILFLLKIKTMKYTYLFIIMILLVCSCKSKETVEIKQVDCQEMVTILPNLKNTLVTDSIPISIPSEFIISINSPVYYINWFYVVNGKILRDGSFDFQVYNKKNIKKVIHQLDFDKSYTKEQISIIFKERNHLISKKEAKQLLKKYNIKRSLDDLKFGDTIKLTSYDKFRSQNKYFINDLNKINDSIRFRGMKKDGSFFYLNKKINW